MKYFTSYLRPRAELGEDERGQQGAMYGEYMKLTQDIKDSGHTQKAANSIQSDHHKCSCAKQ